uniref:Glia maturation factor beta n=1 Tax=Oryctolagus cuniculus TaxID=9986 RepID=A0A5F9CFQ0_RABIT
MAGRKVSESLVVCDVAEDLLEKLRKFHFHKETIDAAIIMKIEKDKHLVVLDEELEAELPKVFEIRNTEDLPEEWLRGIFPLM